MRIGLLEDDIGIQEMLLLVLQDEGYKVTNYPDAEECIQALQKAEEDGMRAPINLLIIDWRLNGAMSGTEVIQQIRNISHLDTLPVILTTAATFNDTDVLHHLHVSLLQKPFAVDEMIGLIEKLTQPQSTSL